MGEQWMTLSAKLRDVDLTLDCKLCGHLIVKKGVGSGQSLPLSAEHAKLNNL
jgi:hypothetical protein